MSRYVLKFHKQGYMKYISHLDLLRLFKRSFKRIGIKLQHSQGFNPHPKMSFVQPLSLGYTSVAEYLEFETITEEKTNHIMQKLNEATPHGIEILACRLIPQSKKTLAAMVECACYELRFQMDDTCDWSEKIEAFLKQDKIMILKKQKKSKKYVEQDIKSMIRKLSVQQVDINNNHIMLNAMIDAGSISNLNPEKLLQSFFDFLGHPFEKEEVSIERKEIFYIKDERLTPIIEMDKEAL
ncbi:TIGR03936 family radical SAM-associated protein [Sinanaerobacter sp. ZZT-01]|uniref:TIGR03936 family radical SAM-associated protein n=1 Tax=Sinanaerobacter sp. ZZT-01 TaxID=3111540 RepID=UPI002D769B37|nr:TIGR03936 family radical SAM-associated protein [Sinanaerobacter sp. ZZT-01]WRR93085.1 TIGR03936 family radical SAM-associated protein [Sinanaerobacter sp. ZZT-01]